MTVRGNPDLVQTPQVGAIGALSITHEMLKMQDDPFEVIEIACEGVQGSRRAAPVKDAVTNVGRKAINVLRIVTVLRVIIAAFG
jgi:hypothetical protein